jgi:hypothetical protein
VCVCVWHAVCLVSAKFFRAKYLRGARLTITRTTVRRPFISIVGELGHTYILYFWDIHILYVYILSPVRLFGREYSDNVTLIIAYFVARMMVVLSLILVSCWTAVCLADIVHLNGTGGSFPQNLYTQSAFAYQFVQNVSFSYHGDGSGVGQCNIMYV